MAHRLNIENGRASMMYVGQVPWHGLGQKLAKPATAAEAISAANLDWEVRKQSLFASDDSNVYPIEGKFAIVPAHKWGQAECPIFGIVGRDYTPLQNRDAFAFFDPIVGEGAAVYETAGALDDGRRIWLLAKLPAEITVADQDIVHKFLLLSNSHDGESSIQIKFTPIRVVCDNTLTMALKDGPRLRVSHTRDLDRRLDLARQNLGLINAYYQRIERDFRAMVKVKLGEADLSGYLRLVFPDPRDPDDAPEWDRVARHRARAAWFFENGKGNQLKEAAGTLWAAYNGVAELVDHGPSRRRNEQRLNDICFGSGYQVKARAFEIAKQRAYRA